MSVDVPSAGQPSAIARLAKRAWGVLGSIGLSCTLLILLGLLTWLGTLEQTRFGLYEVQRKYFESFVLLHDFGAVSLPLPGANLVMTLLALNLTIGGVVRLWRRRGTAGVLIVHLGILLLFGAGFVKWRYSDEGQITLFEGQSAAYFQSPYRCELSIEEHHADGSRSEHRAPQEALETPSGARILSAEGWPFALTVESFARNSRVLRKGPMFEVQVPVLDGLFLKEEPLAKEAEQNLAGAYLRVTPHGGAALDGLVWVAQAAPWTVEVEGRRFTFDLRRERHDLPFEIQLDDFTKVDHPGTSMPRSFESDVTVREAGSERALCISMNEPLRSQGMVVYQASWGPQGAGPGARLFSTFAVVRNPADQWPLIACIVIACGMLLHFGRKLRRALHAKGAR